MGRVSHLAQGGGRVKLKGAVGTAVLPGVHLHNTALDTPPLLLYYLIVPGTGPGVLTTVGSRVSGLAGGVA